MTEQSKKDAETQNLFMYSAEIEAESFEKAERVLSAIKSTGILVGEVVSLDEPS